MSLKYPIYKGEIKNNLKLKKNASIQVSGSTTYSIDDYNDSLNPKGDYIGFRNLNIQYENRSTDSYPVTLNVDNIENNTTKVYNPDDFDVYEELIPVLISENQNGYICSGTNLREANSAYVLFDGNDRSFISNYNNRNTITALLEVPSPILVECMKIVTGNWNTTIQYKLYGSNDGVEYVELDKSLNS
eukprot:jgi/Orpsp1_1/1186129/evm.model.c7180000097092.1